MSRDNNVDENAIQDGLDKLYGKEVGITLQLFKDVMYYDMWCVRDVADKRFDSPTSFHFALKKDAEEFKRLYELAK